MEARELARRHPKVFHVAEDGSLENIRRHGLLSTAAILDLFGVSGERRREIESQRRPEIVELRHHEHGLVRIRDNKPISEKALARCLTDMGPREWYENLNRRVFFWVDEGRLARLLEARAYRNRAHLVLEVETAGLLERHAGSVALSRINSGATFPLGAPDRGTGTFQIVEDFPEEETIVELTVHYAVPDIAELLLSVSRWRGSERIE